MITKILPSSKWNVFIYKLDTSNNPEGTKLQKWFYFNKFEIRAFLVELTNDGIGGTYFSVRFAE